MDRHIFILDKEALVLFEEFHDCYVLKERANDKYEDTKSMFLSKSLANALRVAAVQCALRFVVGSIEDAEFDDDITNAIISKEDMSRALTLVKYSVNCLSSISDSINLLKKKKRPACMPNSDVIDRDFLLMYKAKINKILSHSTNNKIAISYITRNHLYPKIGGKSTSADCMKFLCGLQFNGIGKIIEEENGSNYFVFVEKENASVDQLELIKDLDLT